MDTSRKTLPDAAALVLRLSVGFMVAAQAWLLIPTILGYSGSFGYLFIGATAIVALGSLFVVVGYFGRISSIVVGCFYLVTSLLSLISDHTTTSYIWSVLIAILPIVSPYVAIALIGSGKYSIDYLMSSKRSFAKIDEDLFKKK